MQEFENVWLGEVRAYNKVWTAVLIEKNTVRLYTTGNESFFMKLQDFRKAFSKGRFVMLDDGWHLNYEDEQ